MEAIQSEDLLEGIHPAKVPHSAAADVDHYALAHHLN